VNREMIAEKIERERLKPSVDKFISGTADDHDVVPTIIWLLMGKIDDARSLAQRTDNKNTDILSRVGKEGSETRELVAKSQQEIATVKEGIIARLEESNKETGELIAKILSRYDNDKEEEQSRHKRERFRSRLQIALLLINCILLFALAAIFFPLIKETFLGK
jgi:hypothetical protein